MRKGYRIAMACIGFGMMALCALAGWEDEEQTVGGILAALGICLAVVLLAVFWPQFVRWRARRVERLRSREFKTHRDSPVTTFLGGLVAFLLCGWLFYPTSMKENTLLVLLAVLGVSVASFAHGWWSEKQGPRTTALSSLVLFLLATPLLVLSEEGPHYWMIPLMVILSVLVSYGQYRVLTDLSEEAEAGSEEPSVEETMVEKEESIKQEEA